MKILLIILLFSNICFADDSYYINKDEKAKFSGYLLPEDTVKDLRNNTIERDAFKIQLDLSEKNNTLKDQEIKLYSDQNDKLANSLRNSESMNNWERVLYFSLGIIVTSLAVKGAQQLQNH